MERIWSTEIVAHVGERVRLAGWLHRLRQLSNLSFLVLRDAKGLAQIVVEEPELIERLAGMAAETSAPAETPCSTMSSETVTKSWGSSASSPRAWRFRRTASAPSSPVNRPTCCTSSPSPRTRW